MRGAAATGQLLERSEELARIESALAEARTGRGTFRGDRRAGRDWQDGAARGGADRGGRGRNARASGAGDRAGARFRLRSGASAFRAAAGRGIGARARRSAASRCRRGGRPPRASGRTARRTARPRRASIPRSRSSTASTGCARIWPPWVRSAWSSTTRTGQTPPSLRYLAFLLTRLEELDVALVLATRPREAGTDAELLATVTTDPSADSDPPPSADESSRRRARGVEAR